MSDSSKRKVEFVIERGELPQLLAKFGEDVKTGAIIVGGNSMDLTGFRSLEIKVKPMGEEDYRIKVKVKYPKYDNIEGLRLRIEEDENEGWPLQGAKPGRIKYDDLKERMKTAFKAIARSLEKGQMPDKHLAQLFLEDCKIMTTYSGKGDEYYPLFLVKVEQWADALEQNDIEALNAAHLELDQQKKVCHDRHK